MTEAPIMEVAEDFSAIVDTARVRTAEHHRRGKKKSSFLAGV